METTAPVNLKTNLPNHIRSFLIGWSLIIIIAWFGSLWIVTGLLGLRQDDYGWQVYSLLISVSMFVIRPLFLVWWFRSIGFKSFPVSFRLDIFYFPFTANYIDYLTIFSTAFFIGSVYDLSIISWFPMIFLSNILYLIVQREDGTRGPQKTLFWVIVWVGLSLILMLLTFSGIFSRNALSQIVYSIPYPLTIFTILGLFSSIFSTATFAYGLNKWINVPNRYRLPNKPKRWFGRFDIPISLTLIVGFFVLFTFFSPGDNAILNGLLPCGWIDQKLRRSACIGRWQSHGGNQGLISPDGARFVEYEVHREYTVSRPALRLWSLQGQRLQELSLETFSPATHLDTFYYLPERELLAFTVLDSGTFIWDVTQDSLIALPARSAHDRLRDLLLIPDGESLITVAQNGISVWLIESQQEVAQLDMELDGLKDAQIYTGTSEIHMLFEDGATLSWDFTTDELSQVDERIIYTEGSFETAFIGENGISNIVTVKGDELLLWPTEGEVVQLLGDPSLDVNLTYASVVVSPDGRTLLASGHDWMQVWRVSDGASLLATKTCLYRWDCLDTYQVSISNTGVIARFSFREIRIWSLITEVD